MPRWFACCDRPGSVGRNIVDHEFGGVAREVASTNDSLRRIAEGVFVGWIEAAASFLERSGLSTPNAREVAATLVATIEGGFVLSRTLRSADEFRASGRHMRMLIDAALAAAPPAVDAKSDSRTR